MKHAKIIIAVFIIAILLIPMGIAMAATKTVVTGQRCETCGETKAK